MIKTIHIKNIIKSKGWIYMKETQIDIEEQLLKKIEEMESDDYIFPDRFNKKDYIITITVAFVCLVGIILGAYLG